MIEPIFNKIKLCYYPSVEAVTIATFPLSLPALTEATFLQESLNDGMAIMFLTELVNVMENISCLYF